MKRTKHRWSNCRQTRPLRRKTVEERETFADGTLLASRWRKFSRASSDLLDEAIAAASKRWVSFFDSRRDEIDEQAQRVTWYSRVPWAGIIGWLILLLTPVMLYFYWGPFRRVTRATYLASYKAIKRELSPKAETDEYHALKNSIRSAVKSIMPETNRGPVVAPMLTWLQHTRPNMSLKQRINEIEKIDSVVTAEVRFLLLIDREMWSETSKAGRRWTATRASATQIEGNSCLILVVTSGGNRPVTISFQVTCDLDSYNCDVYEHYTSPPKEPLRETQRTPRSVVGSNVTRWQ